MKLGLVVLLITGASFMAVPVARACGGGVVAPQAATIGADAQRIILAVHDGVTDVITQLGVSRTTADYGVLIPVPSQPTLDAKPVASADLDVVFNGTAPSIGISVPDDGPSCGCPAAGSSNKAEQSPPCRPRSANR